VWLEREAREKVDLPLSTEINIYLGAGSDKKPRAVPLSRETLIRAV